MSRWRDTGVADQVGRRAVVTGANTGLGYQTALALAGAGADVVIAVRDLDRGQEAAQRIRDRVEQARLRVSWVWWALKCSGSDDGAPGEQAVTARCTAAPRPRAEPPSIPSG